MTIAPYYDHMTKPLLVAQGRRRCVLRPGCQERIAAAMRAEAKRRGNVKFVLNVGDSFYPGGVHGPSDPQWTEKWADIYVGMDRMPWYSVYGNHDLEASDWRCSCIADSSHCHQVRKHMTTHYEHVESAHS